MENLEPESGTTRDDLVKRIELMESMIAEGRASTMRNGWIFVLWGLVDLAGMGWQQIPRHTRLVWPICLTVGLAIQAVGLAIQKRERRGGRGMQCRSVEAVWSMMGVAMVIYVFAALATSFTWQYSYLAALLIIIGLAHAISAAILHWKVQGVVAAIWWAGAIAVFVCNSYRAVNWIFLLEMCLGMIAFGVYVMWLERSGGCGLQGARR